MDANGAVMWRATYKPFGEATIDATSTSIINFRFPGQYYDQDTGLHYNYHRYYDPKTGRYLSPDPIGLPSGPNLFEYVEGNPVSKYDPSGLWPTWIHNKMIDTAFPSLHPDLKRAIMEGSRHTDKFQDPRFAYMHAMRNKNQSVGVARKIMEAFIRDRLKRYQCELQKGNLDEAYFALGEALHPIMDSTCPAHEGFQWWDNLGAMPAYYSFFYHFLTEQWVLDTEISNTVALMKDVLRDYRIDPTKIQ
jgi:RHS repeat-associated protein